MNESIKQQNFAVDFIVKFIYYFFDIFSQFFKFQRQKPDYTSVFFQCVRFRNHIGMNIAQFISDNFIFRIANGVYCKLDGFIYFITNSIKPAYLNIV